MGVDSIDMERKGPLKGGPTFLPLISGAEMRRPRRSLCSGDPRGMRARGNSGQWEQAHRSP